MNRTTAAERAGEFLEKAPLFRLGQLVTETPHPSTAQLSQTARHSIATALGLLFDVDRDVVETYRRWAGSGAPQRIKEEALQALLAGGRLFFTGCGATGRLSIQIDSIWRDFWQRKQADGFPGAAEWENRTFSVMAGGDFALIKSVEGFEDFTQFGRRQVSDLDVREGDLLFAITEGGETSFVIGAAWQALDAGARVFFVYNNPDSVLQENVERSRQVIDEPRIEKINLTTGPMAITGSTRMQAASIQLCVLLTLLEMLLHDLMARLCPRWAGSGAAARVPQEFLAALEEMQATLASEALREQLVRLVAQEEKVYRARRRNTYFADRLAVDVLTDTTERSPTFCIPTFRKFDDLNASESWSFLFLPCEGTAQAWERLLKRPVRPVEWSSEEIRQMAPDNDPERLHGIVKTIGREEILRFRIGLDGLPFRAIRPGDSAACIVTEEEKGALLSRDGFYRAQLERAHAGGAATAVLFFGRPAVLEDVRRFLASWQVPCLPVLAPVPETGLLLNGPLRVGAKLLLNALSTCTMVRLGRVMGNVMVWVAPSNLKLIDRATRYIQSLTGLSYEDACHRLFEAAEYVAPRIQAGQEYPSAVGLAVIRARCHCDFPEAERRLFQTPGMAW